MLKGLGLKYSVLPISKGFFIRKLFQSTRLYIERILNGRRALLMVNSGDVSVFMKILIRRGISSQ